GLPNDGAGISISSSHNTIGGTALGAGNRIGFNKTRGIEILTAAATQNDISGNAIFSNSGLGIDLLGDGVTANDNLDIDTGANDLQNFPELFSAVSGGGVTTIQGSLNSEPNKLYRIEFFANQASDSSAHGEGEIFLGATNVTTNAGGNAPINTTFPL